MKHRPCIDSDKVGGRKERHDHELFVVETSYADGPNKCLLRV